MAITRNGIIAAGQIIIRHAAVTDAELRRLMPRLEWAAVKVSRLGPRAAVRAVARDRLCKRLLGGHRRPADGLQPSDA
jgi:hypothetical protein